MEVSMTTSTLLLCGVNLHPSLRLCYCASSSSKGTDGETDRLLYFASSSSRGTDGETDAGCFCSELRAQGGCHSGMNV